MAEKTIGVDPDCYANRFAGEGVICTIEDNEHPKDPATYFDATEAEIRKCLADWKLETKTAAARSSDHAFSLSKARDGASPSGTSRVHGCRETSEVTDDDTGVVTGKQTFMRLEIFVEDGARR